MVILLGERTPCIATWFALSLLDNKRAVLVGKPPQVDGLLHTTVPIEGGNWSVNLATGRMLRGDGRPVATVGAVIEETLEAGMLRLTRKPMRSGPATTEVPSDVILHALPPGEAAASDPAVVNALALSKASVSSH